MDEKPTPNTALNFIDVLLLLIAGYGIFMGVLGLPVGLFVGPHILGPAVCHLAAGIIACYLLARRLRRTTCRDAMPPPSDCRQQ